MRHVVCVCVCVCVSKVLKVCVEEEVKREREIPCTADMVCLLCSPHTSLGGSPSSSGDGTDHSASLVRTHSASTQE